MPKTHKKFELSPRLKFGVGRGFGHNQLFKFSSILFLILAIGLTFNAFRLILKDRHQNQAASLNSPQVLGASDVKSDTEPEAVQFVDYKIQKGDTLFNVSQKYNINWTTLATLNNLKSPFILKPGSTIKVPR